MDASGRQERRVAKEIGGLPVPASGAFWHRKGDARSAVYLVEAKRTDKGSFSIKGLVWDKIRREALIDGRVPVLQVEIQDRRLAVIDWEDFLAIAKAADSVGRESGMP